MTYPTDRPATWFVTGTSRGLGLELVKELLRRGENVAATSRSLSELQKSLGGMDTSRLLELSVDLSDANEVNRAIQSTINHFGGLDVVVNNAGNGYLAAVEEVSDADARTMFDVQVFGVLNVVRAALPGFRAQRSGHIINVSSILGLLSFPGWSLYAAGKFALTAISESLAAEVSDYGITVNLVEPGYMRTDFLTVSLAQPSTTSDAYPAIRTMVDQHVNEIPGNQPGDPAKVAAAIIIVATTGDAPLHQFLGSDSIALAEGRLQTLAADLEASRQLALTTDFSA